MKRKYQRTLSIPAIREYREAIKRGDIDPLENSVCPFPEREYCDGCGNWLEEEMI